MSDLGQGESKGRKWGLEKYFFLIYQKSDKISVLL